MNSRVQTTSERIRSVSRQSPGNRRAGFFSSHRAGPGARWTITSAGVMETTKAVKAGFPYGFLDELQSALDIPAAVLSSSVNIAPRTLVRRRREGKLHPDESERVLRISLLFHKAISVFGSELEARSWFKTPLSALDGQTPLQFAETEPGAREVENVLGRVEHGVFS